MDLLDILNGLDVLLIFSFKDVVLYDISNGYSFAVIPLARDA